MDMKYFKKLKDLTFQGMYFIQIKKQQSSDRKGSH